MLLSADGSKPATHAAYSTPCSDEFIQFLELDMNSIHGMIVQDYSSRWNDIISPTLEDVTNFMNSLIYEVDTHIYTVLNDNNLQLIKVEEPI